MPEANKPVADTAAKTVDIKLPQGEPTVAVEITTDLDVPFDLVWRVLDDVHLLARCLPGAELTDDLGENAYAGRARVAVGPIKLSFNGFARIVEHDRDTGTLRVLAQGQDTGGAQTQADITLVARPTEQGTQLRADAAVYLTGRIAQFGRALAGDISRRMFEQFAEAVKEAATSGEAPQTPAGAPSALRLLLSTLLDRLRRIGRRKR